MKPRLLIILNRLVVGGQSIDTVPLADKLKDGYDILIAYGQKEKDEKEFSTLIESCTGIAFKKIHSLKRSVNLLNDILAIFSLYKLIKEYEPVIVHTHGSKPGVNGRIAAWLANVRIIIHTFHGHLFHSYYNKFVSSSIIQLEKFLGRITSKIIVLGEQQRKEICDQYKIARQDKVTLIPLGIDEIFYNANAELLRNNFRNKYHLSQDCIAIGIIGRIVPVKNHKLFAEIVIRILGSTLKEYVKFFVVGDGYYKKEIFNILTNAGIACGDDKNGNHIKVVFTSWVTPVTNVLHGLDMVVLTSFNEGTPLSLIEAQMCAKPVVAVDVGGVRDTFINNESGYLIENHDAGEFTNKLSVLINDKELRTTMGEKGYLFAKERFSKPAEIKAFRKLYADCITSMKK
ncbi:MAG TPA: glycosyltransferase [Chitinophagaceae bacterium]